jgi:hypothetical protein
MKVGYTFVLWRKCGSSFPSCFTCFRCCTLDMLHCQSVWYVKGDDFATSTTLTLFSLLKDQVLCSLKILNSLIKMVCERRIMVQNIFSFRRPNTSVCTLLFCCELCVFAWKIWGYGNVHISKLRKSDRSDSHRLHAHRWMERYDKAPSRLLKLFVK